MQVFPMSGDHLSAHVFMSAGFNLLACMYAHEKLNDVLQLNT